MNMGRKCPWTKAELKSLYDRLETYTKALTMRLVATEGIKSSMEAMRAYNMFKFPVVYVFTHYHYGRFEDLGMKDSDISSYIQLYGMMAQHFTEGVLEGLQTSDVFYYDQKKELSLLLEDVCREVLFILKK